MYFWRYSARISRRDKIRNIAVRENEGKRFPGGMYKINVAEIFWSYEEDIQRQVIEESVQMEEEKGKTENNFDSRNIKNNEREIINTGNLGKWRGVQKKS